mmetsp:Transcript_11655/g.34703  ORF Transcript_11655/g.34703 Transcript_11655/m.34703 type:complete len:550 (+) Transcript_11655:221-1870(+)
MRLLFLLATAALASRRRKPAVDEVAEQRKRAEKEYYEPYKFYSRPVHLLTDVAWGNFERRSRKPRACALPSDQGVTVYLFCFLREDSPGLLAHFLRWYRATGIDLARNSRFVVHGNGTSRDARATDEVFGDYGVPESARSRVKVYSSALKVQAVNAFLDTLSVEDWLVYPDLDEFFAYPCIWGGRVLPLVDHMARQSVDGPMAASIVADTSKKEFAWLRQLAATTPQLKQAPWNPKRLKPVDFVGGEMYDRIADSWALEDVVPPPRPNSPDRWTDADPGETSIFRQFPHSLRATGCLLHARPFKHALTSVGCKTAAGTLGTWRQRFENSHLTGCYEKNAEGTYVKVLKEPAMHELQLAFAHFRFTSNATASLADKKRAYEQAAKAWREARGESAATDWADLKDYAPADRAALANLNHARKAYAAQQLLFERAGVKLRFRDEVQLVLLLDCNEDRPLPKPDASGERPPMLYGPETSGRLADEKRRALLSLLAVGDPEKATKMARQLFSTMYADAKNLTRSKPLNKRLAAYQQAAGSKRRRGQKRRAPRSL